LQPKGIPSAYFHITYFMIFILLPLSICFVIIILWFSMKLNRQTQMLQIVNAQYIQEKNKEQESHASAILKLQEELKESERLAIVSRQTENAVMLMDPQGNIVWVNESFERMYEYTYDEFIAKLGNNIRRTSFNPKIHERLERCTVQKLPVIYEALNITRSGKEIWTRTSLLPLLSDTKEVIGLVTVDSDIHQRVAATEELIKHIHTSNEKIEHISEQLNVMVDLTTALFERIDVSQRRIERTDQIIGSVKQISDQTKILGINASIEAYVAGDHGKSFRVIASEIVNVSNVTATALREINDLIVKIQQNSDKLSTDRERSEVAISSHRTLIDELRREINEVQSVIEQIK
jgi:PAS domain S-box-containing protein